jgi:transketolase
MNPLMQLRNHGQTYWLDDLTRRMIASGELAQRIGSEDLRGVTSNPSIFAKALQHGDGYTHEIADAAAHGENPQQIYEELVTSDA